jgi:hypothetical protein
MISIFSGFVLLVATESLGVDVVFIDPVVASHPPNVPSDELHQEVVSVGLQLDKARTLTKRRKMRDLFFI